MDQQKSSYCIRVGKQIGKPNFRQILNQSNQNLMDLDFIYLRNEYIHLIRLPYKIKLNNK